MSSTIPSRTQIITAYRTLLRSGLKAVKYATPARFVIQQKLRAAFVAPANGEVKTFDQTAINNTKQFLENAAATYGLEHRIVRNMCSVHSFRSFAQKRKKQLGSDRIQLEYAQNYYEDYEATIDLLNKSMNLALR